VTGVEHSNLFGCEPRAVLLFGDMSDESPAWEYVPGFELPEAYQAFEFYRDSDPRVRSISTTAAALGYTYARVLRWANLGMWRERVASYDSHRDAERLKALEAAQARANQSWAEERAEVLTQAGAIVKQQLLKTLSDVQTGRLTLRPNELKQLLDVYLKYSNLANGDATERVDGIPDFSNMSDEQIAGLAFLRDLAKGKKE